MYTVKLTHGIDRDVVSTTRLDVVNLTQVVDAAAELLHQAQQAGHLNVPDGYIVFDEDGHEVTSDRTGHPRA